MGNEGASPQKRGQGRGRQERDPKIGIEFSCPSCQKYFPPRSKQSEVHAHIHSCIKDRYYKEEQEEKKHQSLFKLNPDSGALIGEVPVAALKQRSRSHQKEKEREAFNLFEQQQEQPAAVVKPQTKPKKQCTWVET